MKAILGKGSTFIVAYTPRDCAEFNRTWPCSKVHGWGAFEFFKHNSTLVDCSGTASGADGEGWLAFCADCEHFGRVRLGLGPNLPISK